MAGNGRSSGRRCWRGSGCAGCVGLLGGRCWRRTSITSYRRHRAAAGMIATCSLCAGRATRRRRRARLVVEGLRMILIPLHGRLDGKPVVVGHAIVDDDSDAIRWKWRVNRDGYAFRSSHGRKILMHRQVLGLKPHDGAIGDHINRRRLDNRRVNLRVVDTAGNSQNKDAKRSSASGHRGVSWDATNRRWKAGVRIGGRQHSAGSFTDLSAAVVAVEALRRKLHPFATP